MIRRAVRYACLAVWAWALPATAQIDISWSLANNRTVLMEPIRATVRIANFSGRDLDLGPEGNARLRFIVEDQPHSSIPATGAPLVRRAFTVPNQETREITVDLLDSYRIVKGQSYMLTPRLEFAGATFSGSRLAIEVQPGLELFGREYGMAILGDGRRASLRLIHRDRADRLFFRMDDSTSGLCLGVYELGRVIRFFTPRVELDRHGVFHVLHQTGPDRFVLSRFDYGGQPLGQGFYSAEVGSLRLVRRETGEVEVVGGTPYVEDPENPGMLTAPSLPSSNPYGVRMGELPLKGRAPGSPPPRRQRRR